MKTQNKEKELGRKDEFCCEIEAQRQARIQKLGFLSSQLMGQCNTTIKDLQRETRLIDEVKKLNYELHKLTVSESEPTIKNSEIDESEGDDWSDFFAKKFLVVKAIRMGLPYKLFLTIQNIIPYTLKDWSDFLDISPRSLTRYRKEAKPFKSIHSEKIIELVEVTMLGIDVFGNYEKYSLWLDTPSYALGNLKPSELLKDSYGKAMVIGELTKIDHGIFV